MLDRHCLQSFLGNPGFLWQVPKVGETIDPGNLIGPVNQACSACDAATPALATLPQGFRTLRPTGVGKKAAGLLFRDLSFEDLPHVDTSLGRWQKTIAQFPVLAKCVSLRLRGVDDGSVHYHVESTVVRNVFGASLQRQAQAWNRLSVGPGLTLAADLESSFH
jgi:hypothetical protein